LARHGFDPLRHRLVLLNPHCRKDANRWAIERYIALAKRLLELDGVRVAVTGGAVSASLADQISQALGDRIWRADGKFSLLGSAELFSKSGVLVTGDTGPMHIAVAVGTPVVALFGPANSLRTGPYATDVIVLDKRLRCAPCYARSCPLRYDPPLCMDSISVDEVYQAVLQPLKRAASWQRPRRLSA
jgi:ADP-heptose:LPS heptosyltransferase